LALETIYARQTGGHISGNATKLLDVEDVAHWGWSDDVTLAAQVNVLAIQAMGRGIDIIERRLHERVKLAPEYKVLKTEPGIGEVLSTVIMLETGPIERFTSVGNYASYARCVGSGRFSNSKKKGEGNRKTAIRTWLGPLLKRLTSHCEPTMQPNDFMNASARAATRPWPPKPWHINWRGPATTC
jgi:transposase